MFNVKAIFVLFLIICVCSFSINNVFAAEESKQILIGGGRTQSPWYAFAQCLANSINKKSEWLNAEVVSTAGVTGNVDMIKKNPKKYVAISSFSHIHYRDGHEWGEKRGSYNGERFIASASSMTQAFVTYDKDIKKVQDLAGKKVDIGRRGGANTPDHKAILKEYGVLDDVKLVYTGYGGGATKLKDGVVDASLILINHIYPQKFSKGSMIEKLQTRGPVYYVGFDRDKLLKIRSNEFATLPVKVPAGALDPKTQPEAMWAYNDATFFSVDEKMDKDIVKEVTRVIWETPPEEWKKWQPMGEHMTHEIIPAMPSKELYKAHPGAIEFYESQGVELKDLANILE